MVAGASFGWTGMSLIVAGTPAERSGRLLVAGPVMMALGLLGVALLMPIEPAPIVFPAIALVGAGIGACWAFIAQRVMSGARAGEENLAASSVATVQQTGFALGAALAGLVANAAGLSAGLTRTDIAESGVLGADELRAGSPRRRRHGCAAGAAAPEIVLGWERGPLARIMIMSGPEARAPEDAPLEWRAPAKPPLCAPSAPRRRPRTACG